MARRAAFALPVVLLAALALLSGCIATDDGAAPPQGPAPEGSGIEAPASAAAAHGPAQRTDSPVTVTPGVMPFPGYTARQTVTIRNSLAGFAGAQAEYATPGGGLVVRAGPAGGYEAVVELTATAITEAEARAALQTMHVDATDAVEGGVLRLAVKGRIDPAAPAGPILDGNHRSISMEVALDPRLAYALAAASAGGGLSLEGLHGPSAQAASAGGGLDARDLRFAEATLASAGGGLAARGIVAERALAVESAGGGLSVEAAAAQATIESGGGGVSVELRPLATGTFAISSGGGGVSVQLARGDGIAYDVHARSGGGGCSVEIHDAQTTGSDTDKRARSAGFDAAPIQATVEASSGGGGLSVHD